MPTGNLAFLKANNKDTIAAITDASYPGDPSGTHANDAYMQDHVAVYLKDLGTVVQPDRVYKVSPANSALLKPFYATIADALTDVKADGSGSSNKAEIEVEHKYTTYSDALTFDGASTPYILVTGKNKYGNVISGAVSISTGTVIFQNLYFQSDITIGGGTVHLINCDQLKTNKILITAGCTVKIADAKQLGRIEISSALSNVVLNLEHLRNVGKNGSSVSIIVPNDLTTPVILIDDVKFLGTIDDTGNLITEKQNYEENATERINI